MQVLINSLKISYESFRYRVEKHEANNLLATLSMLLAFPVAGFDLFLRVVFATILNLFIYLSNDYCDLDVDLQDPGRDRRKVRFMAEHLHASRLALIGELLLLGGVSAAHVHLYRSPLLPLAFVINVTLYHAYSRRLKRIPIVDLLAMTLAGATSTMVGAPQGVLGLQLLVLLGMLSGSYEVVQVIRDAESDEQQNVRTTAVFLGQRPAAWLFRAMVLGAALFGVLFIGAWAAAGFALAVLLPLSSKDAARSWDKARVIFGVSWIGLLVQISLGR